jgi:hypothetical protein
MRDYPIFCPKSATTADHYGNFKSRATERWLHACRHTVTLQRHNPWNQGV